MAFGATEVEDGTGLSTALVYEQAAAAATWLTHAARGLTVFDALSAGNQDISLLNSTRFAEDLIRHRVDGVVLTKAQALTFPRVGCTDRLGRSFDSDETPPDLLAMIRHLAELDATSGPGSLLRRPVAQKDMILSRSDKETGSVTYRKGAHSIESRYPEAWAYGMRLFDPSLRRATWAA